MDIALISILLVITQAIAKTTTDRTNPEAKSNNTILPRQSGYGLIKFEGHPSPSQIDHISDANLAGRVSFEDQPSSKPFRFVHDNRNPNRDANNESSKNPTTFHEFGQQNPELNQDVGNQGYGIYNPGFFGSQDPNINKNQPEEHPGFINPNPAANTNIPGAQSGYGLLQDDNQINHQVNGGQKKKRRRRRKPKQLPGPGYGFAQPGGPVRQSYPLPFINGQPYKHPDPRRPSLAEEALLSITTALTSVARYDDLQCVPRLLCEVAGGSPGVGGGTAGSGLLASSVANLQPLVTLLAAYNGISTSPLFVFGRAVLLGMTSKGNAGTCRYAYSQCPNDPEKLVEYLNNHNGGFFRFFNNPQSYGQQNLEQFYGHLSGNYGLYQPLANPGQNGYPSQSFGSVSQYQQLSAQRPGATGPEGSVYPGQSNGYGFLNPGQSSGQYPYRNPTSIQYGIQNPMIGQNYGLYHGNHQYYGVRYPYPQGQFKNAAGKESGGKRIEKRIQNRPGIVYIDAGHASHEDGDTKWTFPDNNRNEIAKTKQRFGRTVAFPEKEDTTQLYKDPNVKAASVQHNFDNNKKAKDFAFPEIQSNRQYIDYYDYPPYTQILHNNNFKLDEHGFYVESNEGFHYHSQENKGNPENEDGVELVYVLRGNGDPNKPEIVKLKPGQQVM